MQCLIKQIYTVFLNTKKKKKRYTKKKNNLYK